MIEFENSILIQAPISEVYGFLVDLENLPKWNYYVLEVTPISGQRAIVGATYHQVRKTDEQNLSIEELVPNQRIVVNTLKPSPLMLEMTLLLDAEGTATRLRDAWKLDTGRPALLERLGQGTIKAAAAQNLQKLKELLETGRVVLQDGRVALR